MQYKNQFLIIFSLALIAAMLTLNLEQGKTAGETTGVPSGYGRYCSVMNVNGSWGFLLRRGQKSDPCGELMKTSPAGTTIMRAGLWSHSGENNVLARCNNGEFGVGRGLGKEPAVTAEKNASGKNNCIFVISPTHLPVFTAPYGKTTPLDNSVHQDVTVANVHTYNFYSIPISVTAFGQTPSEGHPDAHSFDRKGRQLCRSGSLRECCPLGKTGNECRPMGCHIDKYHGGYDWLMPVGKPIRSVAAGRVIMARPRDVSKVCPDGFTDKMQQEIYIMHTISEPGGYGEKIMSYYAHMKRTFVKTGDVVERGQVLGAAGTTGCSSGNHLHFSTARITNTSGFLEYPQQIGGNCGDNSLPVMIDPFGWAAPQNIDPYAWIALGNRTHGCTGPNPVSNPGAFSINLWKKDSAPPNKD